MHEEDLMEMAEETQRKLTRLLKEYPCIYFTLTTDKKNVGAKDVSFNEQYLNEMGFSFETYSSTLFQEGSPR